MPGSLFFWVGSGLTAFGLLFFFIGFALGRTFRRQRERATVRTTAAVVDLAMLSRRQRDGYHSTTFSPTYEFYINGEAVQVRSSISQSPSPVQVGDEVELYYNPDNYKEIYIEREGRIKKLLTVIFCATGGLIALTGLAVCIFQLSCSR